MAGPYDRRSDALVTLAADHCRAPRHHYLAPLELPLSSTDLTGSPHHGLKRAEDDGQTSCSATPSSSSQELSPSHEGATARRRRRRARSALHPCPPSPFAAAAVQSQVVPPEPVREGQASAPTAAPPTPANLPPSPVASSYQDARSVCSTQQTTAFDRPSACGAGGHGSRRFVHSASNNAMVCSPASAAYPPSIGSHAALFGGASGRELMEHLNSLTAQARLRQQREAELARGGGSGRAHAGGGRPEIVPEPATMGAGGYGPLGGGAPGHAGAKGGQRRAGWLRRVLACGGGAAF